MKIVGLSCGVIAALMLLVAGVVVYRLTRVLHQSTATAYGPFEIHADAATAKRFDINYGIVDGTSVQYSIWHNGSPIHFPSALQSNTGLPYLWRVFAIEGTPVPTLIAGSQSLFLIQLVHDQPVVTELASQFSDFATLQFLDSEDGQPGPEITVFAQNSVAGMEQLQVLSGGQRLLVCGTRVLDLSSGKQWTFCESGRSVDNYGFPNPPGALGFSPDQRSIVFAGGFQTWNANTNDYLAHAMVVVDFENNESYVVPFDDTATRLTGFDRINRSWFESRFRWINQPDNAAVRLELNTDAMPFPWLGELGTDDNYYNLYPVGSEMLTTLMSFVQQHTGLTDADILADDTGEYTGHRVTIGNGELKLDLCFQPDDRRLSLSSHLYLPQHESAASIEAVRRIAAAFNQELASGKHQDLFVETLRH